MRVEIVHIIMVHFCHQELKLRIQQEHETEKLKFEQEMQKMAQASEIHAKTVKDQETLLNKQKVKKSSARLILYDFFRGRLRIYLANGVPINFSLDNFQITWT